MWFFMNKTQLKQKISNAACMPKDVVLGIPIVTMYGNTELIIENYRGILEYSKEYIRIQTKIGSIHIHGKDLEIPMYSNCDTKITGWIDQVTFRGGM